ncbi:MAG: class I SAM-dependent methyltransferase [Eubacterium sp.]|nr:class I SAM-dependent methyltransferase [Eubacterium sp.]
MYLIWCAGEVGSTYLQQCNECNIQNVDITDSNEELWGTSICGHIVISPEDALKKNYKYIIVAAEARVFNEVYPRIKEQRPNDIIVSYGRTVVWGNGYLYDMGNMKLGDRLENNIYLLEDFASHLNQESLNDLEKFVIWGKHTRIDKWMHYYEAYDRVFSKYRGKAVAILEIGVRGGGSVQMWKDYFDIDGVDVKVYGIDINPKCKEYETDKIEIFIGSQDNKEFLEKVKKKIGKVDIIIDDGGHTMNQQIVSLEVLWDCLKDDGTYLCEDTFTSYLSSHGGSYNGKGTFIEYSKSLVDYIHAENSETDELKMNHWSEEIKSICYYNGLLFMEKCSRKNHAYDWIIEGE